MSPHATFILAACAIYGYVCAYYSLLATRRRGDPEYLAFGLLSGGLCLYAFSEVLLVGADDVQQAVRAYRVGSVGLLIVSAFLLDFMSALTGRRPRFRPLVYVWAIGGLVLLSLGLLWEPGAPSYGPFLTFLPSVDYHPVRPTALGMVYLGTGALVPAGVFIMLLRAWPHADDVEPRPGGMRGSYVRVILGTLGLALAAGFHDLLIWAGVLRSFRLLEFATLFFLFGMSYMLLDRFVRASRALADRTAELRGAYDDLRAKQHRLVRKQQLAAVGELSAVIAHEVRNPLAVIKNAVSGLRRSTLAPPDRQTLLSILDEETSRLNRLMHDLLAYARPVLPQAHELEVKELVQRAVERAMGAAADAARGIEVVYDLQGPEHVFGDSELLRHALVNVLENAIQAMPRGGTLTVSSRAAELDEGRPGVAIGFRDTGEGMDAIVAEKARDPFFTTRPAGTGLGLAIVERVVRNHAGTVRIESEQGEGTEVILSLPGERTSLVPIPPPEGGGSGRLSGITEVPR